MTELETMVAAARLGDERAWRQLVSRFTPLVLSVIHRYGLSRADAADVNQTLWLRLVEHLDQIRAPAALPMWITQTTRHECLRVVRTSRRVQLVDTITLIDETAPDEALLAAERHRALREGFAQLPERCRELLALLIVDPPVSYEEIGRQLAIPVGSIGPTRARCLRKLRNCAAVAAVTGRSDVAAGSPAIGDASPGLGDGPPGGRGGDHHGVAVDATTVEQR
jgi:RNA polymerase sigma factor (sigma-70 family)